MEDETLWFEILRKEDLLALRVQLFNMAVDGNPARLVRRSTGDPAFLVVHFPGQHIAEEAFLADASGQPPPGPVPVRGWLSGSSRLVFRIPDGLDALPLTLETLLDWKQYEPVLAPGALPPEATQGPGPLQPDEMETALELPAGLLLSPDAGAGWLHEIGAVEHEGRFELWHTRLGERAEDAVGNPLVRPSTDRGARVLWSTDPQIPFVNSLANADRHDIPTLSSDFSLPHRPPWANTPFGYYWPFLLSVNGFPSRYIPHPVQVKKLMLSTLGAWTNLESAWDYPLVIPGRNDNLGYPKLVLEQWTHRMAQGRDQYVRTAKTAFLCDTGHRASIITVTEREFTPFQIRTEQTPQGPVGIFGSVAYLRQRIYVLPQERVKDYAALGPAYAHEGREQPFRRMRITTEVTPALDPVDTTKPFWPQVGTKDYNFQFIAEDWDGRKVTFERPLRVIPLEAVKSAGDWTNFVQEYNRPATLQRRTVALNSQAVAFAANEPDDPGKTHLKTKSVVFQAQPVANTGKLPPSSPPYLPQVASAEVNIPAVEQLLSVAASRSQHSPRYTGAGGLPCVSGS